MGTKMSPLDKELWLRVDEVLYYLWDPIGVSSEPRARGEYESYVPQVFGLLNANADENRIAAYLVNIVTDTMGLPEDTEQALEAARILLEWKGTLSEKYTQLPQG